MAKKRRGRPPGSGRGPGRPSKQEAIDVALEKAELQRAELQYAGCVFLLLNEDKMIDQIKLREWFCYKAGLDKGFVINLTKSATIHELAREADETTGEPDPAPDPAPEPAPVPESEPEPEPVQA